MSESKQQLVVLIADRLGESVSDFLSTAGRKYFAERIAARIADRIPMVYLEILANASDGLSQEELDDWRRILSKVIDEHVDLPFVPDAYERTLVIEPLVDALVKYAQQGASLFQ